MEVLKFGFKYWKRYLPWAILCQLMGFVALGVGLLLPQLGQLILDYCVDYRPDSVVAVKNVFSFLTGGSFGDPGSMDLYYSIVLIFGSMLILRLTLFYIRNNLFVHNGLKMEATLRDVTYKKLTEQSSSVLAAYNTGDLLNTLNSDIIMFKELYSATTMFILNQIFMLITTLILLFNVSWYLVLIPLAITPALIIALRRYLKAAKVISTNIRNRNADLNLIVSENINAVRLVRSFANEALEIEKFEKHNNAIKEAYFDHARTVSRYGMIFNVLRNIAYIGSLALGTVLIFTGNITTGALVAFTGYVLGIMDNITNLNNMMFQVQQYIVSGQRIMEFVERGNLIENPFNPLPVQKEPHVTLHDVSLSFEDRAVLKHIDLDIPYGKKLGVMGGTGSGKTILLNTLTRVHDITDGAIAINGTPLNAIDLEQVRKQFAFVFQDVFLFSNTIDANIAFYDPDAPRETVTEMAKRAQADGFVKELPDGYDTIVGEKGLGLSGGQKQRLSIARALLKDAPILVLDDATSALDHNTEKELLATIKHDYPEKTVIIAAHRVSSVMDCDEIIYLADGEIVERGNFQELMAKKGHVYEIYMHQTALTNNLCEHPPLAREGIVGEVL